MRSLLTIIHALRTTLAIKTKLFLRFLLVDNENSAQLVTRLTIKKLLRFEKVKDYEEEHLSLLSRLGLRYKESVVVLKKAVFAGFLRYFIFYYFLTFLPLPSGICFDLPTNHPGRFGMLQTIY